MTEPALAAAPAADRAAGSPPLVLAAYQCGPGMGSVSQLGWEWYSRLAARGPVTLVTHVRNRAALEGRGAPLAGSEVIYVDTEWFAGPLWRLARALFPRSEHSAFLLASLDYFVFDAVAFWRLRALLRAGARRWHMVHRVTPVTLAAPTWLARLGVPLVLGPLNCGLGIPKGFPDIMRAESSWLIHARAATRLLHALTGSLRGAARILTATQTTAAAVPRSARRRCRAMLENAVDLQRFVAAPWPDAPGPAQPLRVLYVGRLIPLKAVDLLLRACAQLDREGVAVQLEVVGDGPMRADWEALAGVLGLRERVRFFGDRPQSEVAAHMRRCHVFCLPSVRESGGAVLLEAMASARPVIALAYGGPAEIVDEAVGHAVDPVGAEQVVAQIARALREVVRDPETWRAKGLEGRRRAERSHSWPARIDAAQRLYSEILAGAAA